MGKACTRCMRKKGGQRLFRVVTRTIWIIHNSASFLKPIKPKNDVMKRFVNLVSLDPEYQHRTRFVDMSNNGLHISYFAPQNITDIHPRNQTWIRFLKEELQAIHGKPSLTQLPREGDEWSDQAKKTEHCVFFSGRTTICSVTWAHNTNINTPPAQSTVSYMCKFQNSPPGTWRACIYNAV